MQIIDQSIVSHIYTSHILTYNPVSGYLYLTPIGEESILIPTYNLGSGLAHISDQF